LYSARVRLASLRSGVASVGPGDRRADLAARGASSKQEPAAQLQAERHVACLLCSPAQRSVLLFFGANSEFRVRMDWLVWSAAHFCNHSACLVTELCVALHCYVVCLFYVCAGVAPALVSVRATRRPRRSGRASTTAARLGALTGCAAAAPAHAWPMDVNKPRQARCWAT
jgi:hypothetical protein